MRKEDQGETLQQCTEHQKDWETCIEMICLCVRTEQQQDTTTNGTQLHARRT